MSTTNEPIESRLEKSKLGTLGFFPIGESEIVDTMEKSERGALGFFPGLNESKI